MFSLSKTRLIKYSALSNYNDDQFIWQGLERQSEIPELISYIEEKTDYPVEIITDIIDDFKKKSEKKYVLIIDGVENIIPQCTRYRVLNKAEQLEKLGYDVIFISADKRDYIPTVGAVIDYHGIIPNENDNEDANITV